MRAILLALMLMLPGSVWSQTRNVEVAIQKSAVEGQRLNIMLRVKNKDRRKLEVAEVKCVLYDSDNQPITTDSIIARSISGGAVDFEEGSIDLKGRNISFDRADCRVVSAFYE